jgi:hypothetical protein
MGSRERRPHEPDEGDLSRALASLQEHLAYPETPDLARAVRERLAGAAAAAPAGGAWSGLARWWGSSPGLHMALPTLATLVLLVGLPLALSPQARAVVAERLGLPGLTLKHVPELPPPLPAATPSDGAPARGERLGLGQRVTLAEARRLAGFTVLVPETSELGAPDEVYVSDVAVGRQVALVYHPRPGLPQAGGAEVAVLLTQFQGELRQDLVGKLLGPATTVETLSVGGSMGYWIAGKPHAVFYRDAAGQIRDDTLRLAGNTLIWNRDRLTLRIESGLSREQALRIATSVR